MVKNVRVGVLVPSTNQVVEPDFARLMPQGMTFHTERLWNGDVTPQGGGDGTYLLRMNDDLERGVRYLASANMDVIAYCCTSGTYHAGTLEYDGELANRIHGESGLPAITAMNASLEALRHVGARKISIAGPYGNFLLRERLTGMLEGKGLEVAIRRWGNLNAASDTGRHNWRPRAGLHCRLCMRGCPPGCGYGLSAWHGLASLGGGPGDGG